MVAQALGLSSVLAVVYAGTYANRFTPVVVTPSARLQVSGFWDTTVFIANALLFTLVGLQLHELTSVILHEYSWQAILWYAFLVNVAVIATRFVWVLVQEYAPPIGTASQHPNPDWKHAVISAWSGLRGAVSLAAALAIPITVAGGIPLQQRDLVIFLTFSVILVTLVGGGLTLPLVVRLLRVREETSDDDVELRRAAAGMASAALERLDELVREGRLGDDDARRLRRQYEHKRDHVDGHPEAERQASDAEAQLIAVEREALIAMRQRGEIDNTVLRRMQHRLDIADQRVQHPWPKSG
jgi:NhaP-type Na+/H+ or K+/H+ antiporter